MYPKVISDAILNNLLSLEAFVTKMPKISGQCPAGRSYLATAATAYEATLII